MTTIKLDAHDEIVMLECLSMASTRYHTLAGYAEDHGDLGRQKYYNQLKTFCDELSDQIIHHIGRCS